MQTLKVLQLSQDDHMYVMTPRIDFSSLTVGANNRLSTCGNMHLPAACQKLGSTAQGLW